MTISSLLGSTIPSLSSASSGTHKILDLVFKYYALILEDSQLLLDESLVYGTGIPAPLLGFTYEQPNDMTFMEYEYSEYPFLNKQVVANSYIKNNVSFSINALRPITTDQTIITNYATNAALLSLLETYADRGGLFYLNTMWGLFKNLALVSVRGAPIENQGGVLFQITLKKLNFDTSLTTNSISAKLTQIYKGAQ